MPGNQIQAHPMPKSVFFIWFYLMELTSGLGVVEPQPGNLLLLRLGLHASATVMQGGQKGLLFRLGKQSVAGTLVFLKVPTTGPD